MPFVYATPSFICAADVDSLYVDPQRSNEGKGGLTLRDSTLFRPSMTSPYAVNRRSVGTDRTELPHEMDPLPAALLPKLTGIASSRRMRSFPAHSMQVLTNPHREVRLVSSGLP